MSSIVDGLGCKEMTMKTPYHSLPPITRWSKSVAGLPYGEVDPVVAFPWKIESGDKVATAGSCFAQHIARHLKKNGFDYYVTEDGHSIGDEDQKAKFNFGTFSARYGNLYTTRQLLQLFQRAYETFMPQEDVWKNEQDRFVDPFRPNIEPNGFATYEEMSEDRKQHLRQVRKMFETLDIFVFTLGLTEAWVSKADGAVFPVCPGVAGGEFDESAYGFVNFTAGEVKADLQEFLGLLAQVNPSAKIIVTVSPVPLIATAENRHVLVSTTYSKSALRVVCEEISNDNQHVVYFPSYEIITGSFNRGRYFAEDLRSVTEEGVSHVMRLFLSYATDSESLPEHRPTSTGEEDFITKMAKVVDTTCEEELIEASMKRDR